MAKVYDALKRVEQERQRSERAPAPLAVVEREPARDDQALPNRKWWSPPWARKNDGQEAEGAEGVEPADGIEAILGRLRMLEKSTSEKLPGLERLLQVMETRQYAFEKENRERIAGVAQQLGHRVEQLSMRLSILLAAVGLLLLLVLFR